MNFGAVPVADAIGAILAHSVRLEGRRLRKGLVLTAQDVAALARDGHSEVTVARLAPQDCAEDEAAQRLAMALVPDPEAAGIRLSAPFTGRVNIFAQGPCVARFDTGRLLALNGADWVLSRLACGLAVTSADIASMGVGGLLKEIPSRPMPRARKPRQGA